MSKIKFYIHEHPDNVCQPQAPSKAHPSDVGFDLMLVRKAKRINQTTVMYDSSISTVPPPGYYFEIVPRSSLSKTGYMMANSIGVIDPNYRGTLRVVLTQIDPEAEDIALPLIKFQLILRKIHEADIEVIHGANEEVTDRGTGGFGSTDRVSTDQGSNNENNSRH